MMTNVDITRASAARLILLLWFVVITACWCFDVFTLPKESAESGVAVPTGLQPKHFHSGSGRTFVLLIDSLRYETALNAEIMPHLNLMRTRAIWAKIRTTRDAVTVPAVRAMFTGLDRFAIFGFIDNFARGKTELESLFTQLAAEGIPSYVTSGGSFVQFDKDIATRTHHEVGEGDEITVQNAGVHQALTHFLDHDADFVVAHITYTDHVAHMGGVSTEQYAEAFHKSDRLIFELDSRIRAEDNFIVVGDHGHTEDGRHALGLDVPTFGLYRGPGFRPGVALGEIPITDNRLLMSWAAHVPLKTHRLSQRYLAAINPAGKLAPVASTDDADGDSDMEEGLSRRYATAVALLGLLFAICLGFVHGLWRSRWLPTTLFWSLVLGMVLLVPFSWASLLLAAAGAVGLVVLVRRSERPRYAGWLMVATVATVVLFHFWGDVLVALRPLIHEPGWPLLQTILVAFVAFNILCAQWLPSSVGPWITLALTQLALIPTVYRYGAMGAVVPCWMLWGCSVLSARREPERSGSIWHRGALVLLLLALLQPFGFAEGNNFQFRHWENCFSTFDFLREGNHLWYLVVLAARCIVFVRLTHGRYILLIDLLLVAGLSIIDFGLMSRHSLWLPLVTVGCAVAAHRIARSDKPYASHLAFNLNLAALLCAFYYFVRVPEEAYRWFDMFLAALTVSAYLVAQHVSPRYRVSHRVFLTCIALFVTGWVTFAWTFHHMEWFVTYDWFDPHFVEEHVFFFIPLVIVRYLIPIWACRLLLRHHLGPASSRHWRWVVSALLIKLAVLMAVTASFAHHLGDSTVYLEAIQEAAVVCVLLLGLI